MCYVGLVYPRPRFGLLSHGEAVRDEPAQYTLACGLRKRPWSFLMGVTDSDSQYARGDHLDKIHVFILSGSQTASAWDPGSKRISVSDRRCFWADVRTFAAEDLGRSSRTFATVDGTFYMEYGTFVRGNGTFYTVDGMFVREDGTFHAVDGTFVREGGTFYMVFVYGTFVREDGTFYAVDRTFVREDGA